MGIMCKKCLLHIADLDAIIQNMVCSSRALIAETKQRKLYMKKEKLCVEVIQTCC